ncbi:gamma-glutamyl-gamma-aminobutyrate hydrolase family protein [Conexibacter stalactiti]|uniref:Gamma-glutamyl-gamma-aminobutyrate hydrolase family protein n=1 Tax=Conexibacter stalactiti TaxID=1940611 RepID=A0ABU4HLY1_9ACTN|nr:gamma-glutamyl-gamma-aminobutyrate hydrolase family protein [Conexibacter stalactiti]MDW5594302.1 gamma-glutamyl-gamma-aminobutyrate hydrolase family protein [Conexibacter stalactiti]MEC5034944.1 gamma-glutamyl-gamma-aminobutyrate hydrolase family protein [Conexibacter stalactiti]
MANRPVIGILTSLERARWSVWDQQAALTPTNYLDAIRAAGGMALMIAPDPVLTQDPHEALDLVDGLILAGGNDIDPALYGAERHPETQETMAERDAFELAVTRAAMERDLPYLGICRGMQLLNIASGGTLRQHLPEEFGHHEHRKAIGTFDGADHDVRLAPGSLAARAAGEELHGTKSHHHQGIGRVGKGLVVSGWATKDELPEAIESRDHAFVLGVQWHPEADEGSRLIAALVDEARAYRHARVEAQTGVAGGAATPARAT